MKNKLTVCGFILLVLSATSTMAAKYKIDRDIRATNGCKYHVSGWIDVGFSGVNCYNITLSGVSKECPLNLTFVQDC